MRREIEARRRVLVAAARRCAAGVLFASGMLWRASQAGACTLGDPALAPAITITEAPPACCFGSWAGEVRGSVRNVDTDSVAVLLYAHTDVYYVQPFVDSHLDVACDGGFRGDTRGGERYCALLVRRGTQLPATLSELPAPGWRNVLALATSPMGERRIEFAQRGWIVKSSAGLQLGPGPNYFSDSSDNVWVDAGGRLHLRLTERGGRWYGAEVWSENPLGFGHYRFEVEGPIDRLDPSVVFAGFVYADDGDEADIEFGRWGDAGNPVNAQFVVQPDQVHSIALKLDAERSTHAFLWEPDHMSFASHAGGIGATAAPLAAWETRKGVPRADNERMRFNLWLFRGDPPRDGAEVEVVVAAFEFATPTEVASAPDAARSILRIASPAARGAPIDCTLRVRQPQRIVLQLFDARGRRAAAPLVQEIGAGDHELRWRLEQGGAVPSAGVYFVRLDTSTGSQQRKLVLVD